MINKTKKSVLSIGVVTIAVATMLFSSCNSSNEKNETTESESVEKLNEAKEDLNEAKKEYNKKYETFKNESLHRIAENEKTIAALKLEMKDETKVAKADLDKKLTTLEEKNQNLKEKISDYKEEDNEKWESFKTEFSRDMDNLGEALKDLTKTNTK
jgi:gas vesicle protein